MHTIKNEQKRNHLCPVQNFKNRNEIFQSNHRFPHTTHNHRNIENLSSFRCHQTQSIFFGKCRRRKILHQNSLCLSGGKEREYSIAICYEYHFTSIHKYRKYSFLKRTELQRKVILVSSTIG